MISRIVTSIRHNIVAWLALFVALSGTSMAATHFYVLTNVNQIKPSVLKKLHGANGKTGGRGLAGPTGTVGAEGREGHEGGFGKTGAAGATGKAGATGPTGPANGPTGPTGAKGEAGGAGATGATGKEGPAGSGGVLGYARIGTTGQVTAASTSLEDATVTQASGELGTWCITGLTGAAEKLKNVQATIDVNESDGFSGVRATTGVGTTTKCAVGTQISVETYELEVKKVSSEWELVEIPKHEPFFLTIN